jgi:hypothetical protein
MRRTGKGFWISERIGKFLTASYGYICKPGYCMSILAGVNWSDYSYRNHFQSLRTQILNAEGKEGVSNLYSYLLGSDSDVTALTLAAILLYDIELVPQYEMLIMTHPDKRLRKAFGTFKRKQKNWLGANHAKHNNSQALYVV